MPRLPSYTQNEIDALIACPKKISDPPARELKLSDGHWRKDMKMVASPIASNDIKGTFSAFMRINEDFPENFSVGLVYQPNDGRKEIPLLRCNGKHGIYNGVFDPAHPHFDFHIHKADEKLVDSGLRADRNAHKTAEYASFEEALQYFLKAINLDALDIDQYFFDNKQIKFTF